MSEAKPKLEVVPIGEKVAAGCVVTLLEEMLRMARDGEIVAVGIAAVSQDRCSVTSYHAGENATMLVGATYRLLRRVEEHNS